MKIYTIGFTKKTAEVFFERLRISGVKRMVDIRLNNSSQLAGFAKKNDLIYFLKVIAGIGYVHIPQLAPDKSLLDMFKKNKGSWADYEKGYWNLLTSRTIGAGFLQKTLLNGDCLLCSEHQPVHCHRRLVAEQIQSVNSRLEIVHL